MNNSIIPPIPKYFEEWEGPNDPLAKIYPLQLLTPHAKGRANAQFDNTPWIRELLPHRELMNRLDAEKREIEDGNLVMVINDSANAYKPTVFHWHFISVLGFASNNDQFP